MSNVDFEAVVTDWLRKDWVQKWDCDVFCAFMGKRSKKVPENMKVTALYGGLSPDGKPLWESLAAQIKAHPKGSIVSG